jgi:hypothetical protein
MKSFTHDSINNICYLHKNITNLKYNKSLNTFIKKESRLSDFKKHENFTLTDNSYKMSEPILLNDINGNSETCKELCTNLWNCEGFTHDKNQNSCILYKHFPVNKTNTVNPKSHNSNILKPENFTDTYKLEETLVNYNETEQATLKNPMTTDNKPPNILKTIDTINSSICKDNCDNEVYCSGFVINKISQNCELHSKIHNIEDYNVLDGVNIWNKVSINISDPVKHIDKSNPYDTIFETTNLPLNKCNKLCKDLKDCKGLDWIKDQNTNIPYGTCKFKKNIPNNEKGTKFNTYNTQEGIDSYSFESKT